MLFVVKYKKKGNEIYKDIHTHTYIYIHRHTERNQSNLEMWDDSEKPNHDQYVDNAKNIPQSIYARHFMSGKKWKKHTEK